jgi:lysophospholipase L1-like esterase
MRARGRLLSCLVTMVLALAGFVTAGVLPAGAAPSTVAYVALGDSYAAGTAAGSFPNCPHDKGGYPVMLNGQGRIVLTANLACSGETTDEVISHQVPALASYTDTRLVTLTAGAANLGLSAVLAACTAQPPTPDDCAARIADAQRELGDCGGVSPLGGDLIALYGKVAKAAPGARIVVTGYPQLFEPPTASTDPATAKIITAINDATTKLNCVIERAVAESQATYANIYYVDVTKEFAKHGIGCKCTDPFINAPPSGEAFHPTPAGYQAYADAIKTKLPNGWLLSTEVTASQG